MITPKSVYESVTLRVKRTALQITNDTFHESLSHTKSNGLEQIVVIIIFHL